MSPRFARTIDDLFPGVELVERCLTITTNDKVKIDRPFLYNIVKILQAQENGNSHALIIFTGTVTVPTY